MNMKRGPGEYRGYWRLEHRGFVGPAARSPVVALIGALVFALWVYFRRRLFQKDWGGIRVVWLRAGSQKTQYDERARDLCNAEPVRGLGLTSPEKRV